MGEGLEGLSRVSEGVDGGKGKRWVGWGELR